MNDPEDYLNPPRAAVREGPGKGRMGPKLKAKMDRLHEQAKLREAVRAAVTESYYDGDGYSYSAAYEAATKLGLDMKDHNVRFQVEKIRYETLCDMA